METNYQKAKRTLIAHAAIAGIELPEDGTILRMLKLASTPDVVNENDLSHPVIVPVCEHCGKTKERHSPITFMCPDRFELFKQTEL
jgi:hypothetical protein